MNNGFSDEVEAQYDQFKHWTLWELWGAPAIWQLLSDSENHFANREPDERVQMTARLLRELTTEGFAHLVTGPWDGRTWTKEEAEPLPPSEAEAVIDRGEWRDFPPLRDGMNVWLVPTETWRRWRTNTELTVWSTDPEKGD